MYPRWLIILALLVTALCITIALTSCIGERLAPPKKQSLVCLQCHVPHL